MQGVTLGNYTWEHLKTTQFLTTSRQGQAIRGVTPGKSYALEGITHWEELPWEESYNKRSYILERVAH